MARQIRIMEDRLTTQEGPRSGAALEERAALRDAAMTMLNTLPRMFRTVKHRARYAAVPDEIREMGDTQLWVLSTLARGKMQVHELAEHCHVTNPTMSRMVDGLVDKGYVERLPHPSDRRRIYLQLTDKGQEIGEYAHAQFRAKLTQFISPLTDGQLHDIALACRHISTLLPDDALDYESHCAVKSGGLHRVEQAELQNTTA